MSGQDPGRHRSGRCLELRIKTREYGDGLQRPWLLKKAVTPAATQMSYLHMEIHPYFGMGDIQFFKIPLSL